HPILAAAKPAERLRVCQTVLDTMRRELAIKVPYLDPTDQEALKSSSFQFLREPWAFEESEELEPAPVFRIGTRDNDRRRGEEITISPTSGLGQYLRRPTTWPSSLQPGKRLPAAELDALAREILKALQMGGQVEIANE